MILFGPFWRSYTGQIYGRNPAPTPFRTVSEEKFSETEFTAMGFLGNWQLPINSILGNSASSWRGVYAPTIIQTALNVNHPNIKATANNDFILVCMLSLCVLSLALSES